MPKDTRDDEERPQPDPWRRGRVQIVVPTTERWKVGETVRDAADGGAARVIRVRANQLESARKAPPVRQPRTVDIEPRETQSATLSPTSGRSGLVVDEALTVLLRERPELAALRPSQEAVATAFARLEEHDRERWLGMRNGRPRPVRLPARFDLEPIEAALREVLSTAKEPVQRLAAERALELLAQDPHHIWNLALEAVLPELLEEAGATVAALAALLPESSPCEVELAPELAVPLLPYTAKWRLARLAGDAGADAQLREQVGKRARALIDPTMRSAIVALGQRVGVRTPSPTDDAAWIDVALACLRVVCDASDGRMAVLVARPAEVSGYVAVGKELLDAGRPFLADLAFSAAQSVTTDPAKALKHQAEAHEALASRIAVIASARTDAGYGAVVRPAGRESAWTLRWEAHERWPDEAPVSRLDLPAPVLASLVAAGHDTVGSLRAADHHALLALEHVGRVGLRQILAALDARP